MRVLPLGKGAIPIQPATGRCGSTLGGHAVLYSCRYTLYEKRLGKGLVPILVIGYRDTGLVDLLVTVWKNRTVVRRNHYVLLHLLCKLVR